MPVEEDPQLIARFKQGEEAAVSEIVGLYQEALFRFIYRSTWDETESVDLVSQTFIRAYANRHNLEPKAKFVTWLFTIATNLCRDHARKRRRRPGDFEGASRAGDGEHAFESLPAQTADPSEDAALSEDINLLRQAIGELPADLQSAIILYSLEGKSQEEAAALLNCSVKAIETRVYRAKSILRKKLANLRTD